MKNKMDDFPFAMHNYPHLDSNIPCMPTYGVYISQLIRFAKACDTYPDFLTRHQRFVFTLMRQRFKYDLLCRKFKQFFRSHFDLISVCVCVCVCVRERERERESERERVRERGRGGGGDSHVQ